MIPRASSSSKTKMLRNKDDHSSITYMQIVCPSWQMILTDGNHILIPGIMFSAAPDSLRFLAM